MKIDPRWQPALRVFLLMAIFSMAGPEIFAAFEMATLLEMLGAFLFVTAFSTAIRMTAIDLAQAIGNLLAPAPLLSMLRYGRWPIEKPAAAVHLLKRAAECVVSVMVLGFYARFLLG